MLWGSGADGGLGLGFGCCGGGKGRRAEGSRWRLKRDVGGTCFRSATLDGVGLMTCFDR